MTLQTTPVVHELMAGPDTVTVGVIDPRQPRILTVESGDEVVMSTWGHWGNRVLPTTRITDFPTIRQDFPGVEGPHSLTGPITVTGAEPGDALAIDVLELVPARHGFNLVVAHPRGRGVLRERFPQGRIQHFDLDPDRMTTRLGGLEIPLRPFLGIMGVAPGDDAVRSTVEPGLFGGNMDLSELVVGSRLILPVFRSGAGFYCGDGHAVQGDGEVNQTAIEAGMDRVRLRFTVLKDMAVTSPRVETNSSMVTTGFGDTLEDAAADAVDEMVTLLVGHGMHEDDAYTLCSIAGNARVTQLVNKTVGVHFVLDRSLLAS